MAQIPRPPKQGNVMTYVAKVAAGYPHILAGEMDADLDTIYGAWNSGADTVNLRDGAVTSAKLAADSVGPRELQDSGVQTTNLADGAVTTPKLADGAVTMAKLAGGGIPAGTVGAAQIIDGSIGTAELADGAVTAAKLAAGAIPAGSVGAAQIIDGTVGTAELVDVAVTRAKLAVNASNGASVYQPNPTGFVLSTAGVWTTFATLPSLTTRGGAVHLYANPTSGVNGITTSTVCNTRWLRDGIQVATASWLITALSIPLPGLNWIDTGAAAGTHVYIYQVLAGTSCVIFSSPQVDGGFFAMETG